MCPHDGELLKGGASSTSVDPADVDARRSICTMYIIIFVLNKMVGHGCIKREGEGSLRYTYAR